MDSGIKVKENFHISEGFLLLYYNLINKLNNQLST